MIFIIRFSIYNKVCKFQNHGSVKSMETCGENVSIFSYCVTCTGNDLQMSLHDYMEDSLQHTKRFICLEIAGALLSLTSHIPQSNLSFNFTV